MSVNRMHDACIFIMLLHKKKILNPISVNILESSVSSVRATITGGSGRSALYSNKRKGSATKEL